MSNPRNLSSFTLIVTFVCLSLIGVVLVPLLPVKLAPVSYTHLRAHETDSYLVCRLLLEKKKKTNRKCVTYPSH